MLTRKEELFIKPFQQRLYLQHKIKLKFATPRIDVAQPKEWPHILQKEKKYQKEQERCNQILLNNNILMQKLSQIMSTKRIDDHWNYEKPKYFHRVNLFTKCKKLNVIVETDDESNKIQNNDGAKTNYCYACNSDLFKKPHEIPEERVLWNPPKEKLSKKSKSLSIRNDKDSKNNQILNKSEPLSFLKNNSKPADKKIKVNDSIMIESNNYLNYIEINKGSLDVIIKFPQMSKVSIAYENKTCTTE